MSIIILHKVIGYIQINDRVVIKNMISKVYLTKDNINLCIKSMKVNLKTSKHPL